MPLPDLPGEARRQLAICNACRYCAGYCPVWPELELRTMLSAGDLTYLANLCHDCQDCFTACMYTHPHAYDLNPPRVFAGLREETYRRYVWPRSAPGWMRGWRGLAAAFAGACLLLGVLGYASTGWLPSAGPGSGSPYRVLPHPLMLAVVGVPSLWAAGVLALAAARYWRDIHGPLGDLARLTVWPVSLSQAAHLRHMRGGGAECEYPGPAPSAARRRFHVALLYGFVLCVVSTTAAAFQQELLGMLPPFPYLSVPVVTGTAGGLGMMAGGAGLIALKTRADAGRSTSSMSRSDYGFLWALLVLAASGLLVLVLRHDAAFGTVLLLHLAAVVLAFALAPYTKFVHWIYRLLAIYKNNLDARARQGSRGQAPAATG